SVLVLNDPNAITTWAMPRDLMASLSARTPWSRSISTMGSNVSGLKRGEKLRQWKPHIDGIVEPLLSHHDLFLARIERDASQFAYLIETSKKDLWRTRLENDAVVCFGRCGFQSAWLRPDDREFWRIVNVLLKTKEEQKKEELR